MSDACSRKTEPRAVRRRSDGTYARASDVPARPGRSATITSRRAGCCAGERTFMNRLGGRGRGYPHRSVPIGTSLVLIAAGAILHYAVTAHVSGIDIQTVGTILIVVGILGLILSLLYASVWTDKRPGPPDPDAPTRYPPRDRY